MSLTTKVGLCAVIVIAMAVQAGASADAADEWSPAEGPLMTRWADEVSPANAHRKYPRPQMVREDWLNLNGLWDFEVTPKQAARPDSFGGRILVPFPIESALSGMMQRVGPDKKLWYHRTFRIPSGWSGRRVLLHFEAVDWDTTVWINDRKVGSHRGGYDPFLFDVTDALRDSGPQEIVLSVRDPVDAGNQPRGKQVRNPHGIWYTPSTGIWQTAWLEPVAESSIESLDIRTDIDREELRLVVNGRGTSGNERVKATALANGEQVASGSGTVGEPLTLSIEDPRLWDPEDPFLYDLKVSLAEGGKVMDRVDSYFGMREVSVQKDESGITRIFLNGEPCFMLGLLDQGFWPDGLYAAPCDEALRYDVEVTKKLGFNMARKHVKIEPRRWYYWCDKLGLLVWQDMPSGDNKGPEARKQFRQELKQMIDAHRNHPSIVVWVPFNEGWGQHNTEEIVDLIERRDPTRLVDCASGWADKGVGDVHDIHAYPGPSSPKPEPDRAAVLGEFGGLGLPLEGHLWKSKGSWGYRGFDNAKALTDAYVNLLQQVRRLKGSPGLSAAVYTQTTDVEIEVNGVMTYDRDIVKPVAERVREANRKLMLPPPKIETVVPTSRDEGRTWSYTTEEPAKGWYRPDFDASSWKKGPGGFGRKDTPGAVVRTEWTGSDIWLRRTFSLPSEGLAGLHLLIHHDEDAQVYLNGVVAAELDGFTTDYVPAGIRPEAQKALKPGRNVIAVHCKQTGGGQYIDAGLLTIVERNER